MPKLNRIIETALYAADLDRAKRFYHDILSLTSILEADSLAAYDVGGQSVLLLFKRGASAKTQVFAGGAGATKGEIPPHGGSGQLHMCFAIDADQLGQWEVRLGEKGIPIEGRTQWAGGGESIYFRDPDGHLLELMTPGNWPIY